MKCYEVTRCSDKDRATCTVWNQFRNHPEDMENISCWVIKGTYHDEHHDQGKKCRKCRYYLSLNREHGISANHEADIALVSCAGTINYEKTGAIAQVWEGLKKHRKHNVMFDISNVNTIYSCGLSLLVRMHHEAKAADGMMVVVGGREHLHQILHSSRLSKLLHLAPEQEAARQLFDTMAQNRATAAEQQRAAQETAAREAAEEAARAAEAAKPRPAPKRFVRCWEYWQGNNPRNATTCSECFHKQNPNAQACWVVEGIVEGVTFHFVNEECLGCAYFEEFGRVSQE